MGVCEISMFLAVKNKELSPNIQSVVLNGTRRHPYITYLGGSRAWSLGVLRFTILEASSSLA